jgi:DNA-directed RNA polymerase subunit alpha
MKWKNVLMPRGIELDSSVSNSSYGRFVIEPMERGFGTTLGNALRRTLLSLLQGSAVTAIKVDGVLHEMSTIPGVVEDVTDVVLNVKQIVVRHLGDDAKWVRIEKQGPGVVTARDIIADPEIEIINPDLHLMTLDENAKIRMELLVGIGRSYVPAEAHAFEQETIGIIPVDSIFSPIRRVNYAVENTRVGQRTDYDRLVLEIWTNGATEPIDALGFASKILKDHMQLFIHFDEEQLQESREEFNEEKQRMRDMLLRSVDELELSVRSNNCLKMANIKTLGDLVRRSEAEMLKYKNFGRKSLREIAEILEGMGLHFGMDIAPFMQELDESILQTGPVAQATQTTTMEG